LVLFPPNFWNLLDCFSKWICMRIHLVLSDEYPNPRITSTRKVLTVFSPPLTVRPNICCLSVSLFILSSNYTSQFAVKRAGRERMRNFRILYCRRTDSWFVKVKKKATKTTINVGGWGRCGETRLKGRRERKNGGGEGWRLPDIRSEGYDKQR